MNLIPFIPLFPIHLTLSQFLNFWASCFIGHDCLILLRQSFWCFHFILLIDNFLSKQCSPMSIFNMFVWLIVPWFKVSCRVRMTYWKDSNHHFVSVFHNNILKHVFNLALKLNNHTWKKVQNQFFVLRKRPPNEWFGSREKSSKI